MLGRMQERVQPPRTESPTRPLRSPAETVVPLPDDDAARLRSAPPVPRPERSWLRLRTFRRAGLRGLAGALVAALIAGAVGGGGLGLTGVLAAAGAFGLGQFLAGSIEAWESRRGEGGRRAVACALLVGACSGLATALAALQGAAVAGAGQGLSGVLQAAARAFEPGWLATLAAVAGAVFGAATWIRLAPEARATRGLLWAIPLLLLTSTAIVLFGARALDPLLLIVTLVGVAFAVLVGAIVATLLAGWHAWLDRAERRWLPPLPDE